MSRYPVLFTKFAIILSLFFVIKLKAQDNVGIGTVTPDPSSVLDLSTNDKGLLIPRLTTSERLAIINPAHGLIVYDIDFRCFFFYRVPVLPQLPGWVSMCSLSAPGATPTIAVTIQNGITTASITAGSTDSKGNITATGTNNLTNTQLMITYNTAYAVAPIVVVTPNNNSARTATYYVTSTITAYSLFINGGGANPSFNYIVIE
jgi:hypothetical protein